MYQQNMLSHLPTQLADALHPPGPQQTQLHGVDLVLLYLFPCQQADLAYCCCSLPVVYPVLVLPATAGDAQAAAKLGLAVALA